MPDQLTCPHCQAPAKFLYFNDGKRRQQIRCKICSALFQIGKSFRQPKTKYWCPHCQHALYLWKQKKECSVYKCPNDQCPAYLKALQKLNIQEKNLRKFKLSQFKLRYQFREYHFDNQQLRHSSPDDDGINLFNIHRSAHVLGLVLTFHVSFAIAARKTARILKEVFSISISYQTVLNYAQAAAYYCHLFNMHFKGDIDDYSSGDETYIKIAGKNAFTFFFISTENHKITAYHVADTRDTLPAVVAMNEAIRTARPDQKIIFITDGNPSYPAGIHFLNSARNPNNLIQHHQVIGLQNLDEESELHRHFKQISERLNRTYKYHIRAASGFKAQNGAICLTTLFVTHYNFLRPHMALNYKVPIPLEMLTSCSLIQLKWYKIIDFASKLHIPGKHVDIAN